MSRHRSLVVPVLSRAALAVVFIDGGRTVWRAPAGPATGAGPLLERLRRVLPVLDARSDVGLVRTNAGVHVAAGVALAAGVAPRVAAGVLAASLLPTTLAVFSFWEMPLGPERSHAQAAFLKNLAVAGGLLGVIAAPDRLRA